MLPGYTTCVGINRKRGIIFESLALPLSTPLKSSFLARIANASAHH